MARHAASGGGWFRLVLPGMVLASGCVTTEVLDGWLEEGGAAASVGASDLGITFVEVDLDPFDMGCTDGQEATGECESNEYPTHEVALTRRFFLAETELTQGQYLSLTGDEPSEWWGCGDGCPEAHEQLTLPGVLQNPVPVAALFDPEQADHAALRNLLDRLGLPHPEDARVEGREEGRLAAFRIAAATVLAARGAADPEGTVARLDEAALLALLARG